MDVIHYKNPGGPDVVVEIEQAGEKSYKYSLSVRVKIDNNDVIYKTAGEVNSYEAAVAISESLSKWLYGLAVAGREDER